MQHSTPLIQARDLVRRYTMGKQTVTALDGVSLGINQGEFIALVGPSGSGKSTLLNLVGGLDRPTSGELWVADLELGQASDKRLVAYRRDQIGFIFQSFNLLPTRTAAENVEVPLMLAGVGRKQRRERALRLLEQVGLGRRADHKPNELSGGEMQRVAIARALANDPVLILADEPTGNLDSKTGTDILQILRNLVRTRGVTMVLVTHDMKVASYADRVIHLLDGHVQQIAINTHHDAPESDPVEVTA